MMKNKKSGQAMVEYLLLLGVIVGVLALFKNILLESDRSVVTMILRGVKCQIDVENPCFAGAEQAQRGGRKNLGSYYRTSKASVRAE